MPVHGALKHNISGSIFAAAIIEKKGWNKEQVTYLHQKAKDDAEPQQEGQDQPRTPVWTDPKLVMKASLWPGRLYGVPCDTGEDVIGRTSPESGDTSV